MNNLKIIRESNSLTLTDMAASIGISVQRYNAYEKGLRRLPPDIAIKVSTVYGKTLDYIYANELNDTFKNGSNCKKGSA
ncbi:helix-turn-helix domain-containing protein [Anaerotalea alkaliphila]|uniref:Helix-turn-helix transcriptional regulator n=1 Tax=Anaerotalea alkaliphila TaxID=2662126 RepID=A0A7X5HXH9_9FIRM|nr:helix-turn-helix transcriptional regulator [Anaerotalea alkaliphila]NDL68484.1 helix-turn-helix transcriptional regulator [Anaerotalea alkaliphila]